VAIVLLRGGKALSSSRGAQPTKSQEISKLEENFSKKGKDAGRGKRGPSH